MVDPISAAVAGLLLIAEFKWRHVALRLIAIGMAIMLLVMAVDLGPASRRALAHQTLVELPNGRMANAFSSGVLAMKSEGDRDRTSILLPAGMLVWLGLTPVVRRFHRETSP